jgi:hypothetical protein
MVWTKRFFHRTSMKARFMKFVGCFFTLVWIVVSVKIMILSGFSYRNIFYNVAKKGTLQHLCADYGYMEKNKKENIQVLQQLTLFFIGLFIKIY